MTNFERTANWLKACGKVVGNTDHLSTQIGCDLEEFIEFMDCVVLECEQNDGDFYRAILGRCLTDLEFIATKLKKGEVKAYIPEDMREAALDSLCDREVTGNGVAYLAGFDKVEGDKRVLDSNDSKLNEDGTAVILPGGKIGKSDRYQKPDLTGLV